MVRDLIDIWCQAIWFEGKGNIGYGANVGSNHTGRLPDQECLPGEGTFFGLGCNIKYPCNLSDSPYSIIASGITMLPQRLTYPFSLVNRPTQVHEGISPAFNISLIYGIPFFPWFERGVSRLGFVWKCLHDYP